jgi:hypothetical protein
MRYYNPGDDVYFFGFSRGAYTARFLAEMLDHVGLLSAGNEEMCKSLSRKNCDSLLIRTTSRSRSLCLEVGLLQPVILLRLTQPRTFQRWQCRQERNEKEKRQKRYLLEFMCAFRETFSRPVKPVCYPSMSNTETEVLTFSSRSDF